jgi:hypothetical protein
MNSPEKENPTFNEHDNIATDAFGVKIDRESISGWLVVFLYLGLGFGSVGTIIYSLASVLGQGLNVPYTLLLLTPAILIFITGISAIVAFHKRRPNAVSLAKTYIAMIVLDGLAGILIAIISEEYASTVEFLRQFIWAGIWFTYLIVSKKVEAVIPPATRVWDKFEKALLGGFVAVMTFIIIAVTYAYKSDSPDNLFLTNEAFITTAIEEANKELPQHIDEGIIFQAIDKEDNTIIYRYKMPYINRNDIDSFVLTEASLEVKKEFLDGLHSEGDEFIVNCLDEGYDVAIKYVDSMDAYLFGATITKEDYLNHTK